MFFFCLDGATPIESIGVCSPSASTIYYVCPQLNIYRKGDSWKGGRNCCDCHAFDRRLSYRLTVGCQRHDSLRNNGLKTTKLQRKHLYMCVSTLYHNVVLCAVIITKLHKLHKMQSAPYLPTVSASRIVPPCD